MSTICVLHLISLECLLAQEFDGDETWLRLNGEKIWAVAAHEHMSHHLERPHCYNLYQFEEGRKHGQNGWEPMIGFTPGELTFRFDTAAVIEVLEADRFSSDDLLGRQQVSARDAEHGVITVNFERDGAKYALSYRVEPDSAPA